MAPPPMPMSPIQGMPGMSAERSSGIAPMGGHMAPAPAPAPHQPPVMTPPTGSPRFAALPQAPHPMALGHGGHGGHGDPAMHGGGLMPMGTYPQVAPYGQPGGAPRSSKKIVWWVIALLAIGAGVGTSMALLFR